MVLGKQEIVESLDRAQVLADAGLIGQVHESYGENIGGVQCFCALGAVLMDRGRARITKGYVDSLEETRYEINRLIAIDGLDDPYTFITTLNDDEDMSFGQIARKLEAL